MVLHLYVYFVVGLQYNYNFLFGMLLISIFILCLYFVSYYFRNAVDQHLTLYLLCQLLLSGILLISIVMIKFCYDMAAAFHKPCGYTGGPPYIKGLSELHCRLLKYKRALGLLIA